MSMVYGLRRNGQYIEYGETLVKEGLEKLGECMRLRGFTINGAGMTGEKRAIEIFLSPSSELHCLKSKILITNELKHEIDGETVRAHYKRIRMVQSKERKSDRTDIQDHSKFYLMNTATIFPLQIDLYRPLTTAPPFMNRLRPEFLCMISTFLSNGAFLNASSSTSSDPEDLLLTSAGQKLKNEKVPCLLRDLESMTIQPIGSESLSKYFHMYGVNIRLLGCIAKQTDLQHIRDICTTEMIARSTKKIIRANLAEFILSKFRTSDYHNPSKAFQNLKELMNRKFQSRKESDNSQSSDDSDDESAVDSDSEEEYRRQENEVYDEELAYSNKFDADIETEKQNLRQVLRRSVNSLYMDYLNLVFGCDDDSENFWDDILSPLIFQDFNYQISRKTAMNIPQGLLLHAVSYNWRLEFKQEDYMKIFTSNPFDEQSTKLNVTPHSKTYNYNSLSAMKLINEYKTCMRVGQNELAIKYIEIKRKMLKLQMDGVFSAPSTRQETKLFVDLVEVEIQKMEGMKKTIENANVKNKMNAGSSPSNRRANRQNQAENNNPSSEGDFIILLKNYNFLEDAMKRQLNTMPYNHAERVEAMITLTKIYKAQGSVQSSEEVVEKKHSDCMDMYQKIQHLIEYHLGTHHPLSIDLHADQSNYHFMVGKDEQGQKYLQEAINRCRAILARLQNGLLLCQKAFKIFQHREQKYILKCLGCCVECSKASISLNLPKEAIEQTEIIWQLLRKYLNDKQLKRSIVEQLLEFVIKTNIKVIVMSLRSDERNFLLSLLYFLADYAKDQLAPSLKKQGKQSSRKSMIVGPIQADFGLLDSESSLQLQNRFDSIRERQKMKVKQLSRADSDLDEDQLIRCGLYPDNRIYDIEMIFDRDGTLKGTENKLKKREFLEELFEKEVWDTSLGPIKAMFNDLLSKKSNTPQTNFYDHFKKQLLRFGDGRLESLDQYLRFTQIFGYNFFYNLYQTTEFSNVRILDYDFYK